MNISEDQYAEIISGIRVLETELQTLFKQHESMFARLKEQDTILDELKSQSDRGKGALYILLTLGSAASMVIGFFAANAKSILQWFSR